MWSYLFGKYAVIGALDYFGIFIHIQSRIHFNGCWLTFIKAAIIQFRLTLWTLSLRTIRSLVEREKFRVRWYQPKLMFETFIYRLTFWILDWAQSNVAFIVNGCGVWEFMRWKCDWRFGAIVGILKLSHNLTVQWASKPWQTKRIHYIFITQIVQNRPNWLTPIERDSVRPSRGHRVHYNP